jgi:hypothetical protein
MNVAELQTRVDAWNQAYPAGTWVRLRWMRSGVERVSVAQTQGVAFVTNVGDPSFRFAGVFVDGFYTWRELDELTPLTEAEAAAAPAEEHCRPLDRLMSAAPGLRARELADVMATAAARCEFERAAVAESVEPASADACEDAHSRSPGPQKQLALF